MDNQEIAKRYASALSAIQGSEILKVEQDLQLVTDVFNKSSALQVFLESPGISASVKKEKIKKIFQGKISDSVANLLQVLIDRKRVQDLPAICSVFTAMNDEKLGRVRVELTLARQFADKEKEPILDAVKKSLLAQRKQFGISAQGELQIIITERIKPELLGGYIMRKGDYLVNASVSEYMSNWKKKALSFKSAPMKAWQE